MTGLRIFGAAMGVSIVAAGALFSAGFVVNRTSSMPTGIWRVDHRAPGRGDVALVCPPESPVIRAARRARYLTPGVCPGGVAPLLKPVAAIAGDQVLVRRDGVSVNGHRIAGTGLLVADGAGRLLPTDQIGSHVVGEGEVWLISNYSAYSFDSRYFGPVDVARMRGVASPVLTEDRPDA